MEEEEWARLRARREQAARKRKAEKEARRHDEWLELAVPSGISLSCEEEEVRAAVQGGYALELTRQAELLLWKEPSALLSQEATVVARFARRTSPHASYARATR